ncbi:hypothetical protein MPSEU_001047100 [Mayamaea pseudoterrestris]|nr:hypothetical protein MPSEU_001047100 [Mayamaea pseudoterrestris]
MSFFWQDDDDEEPLSQSIFNSSQGDFVSASQPSSFFCQFCQGTDFYVDDTTDRQVCTNCHIESQPSQSQAMDYEEVVGLAAKTHGSIRLLKRPKMKSSGNVHNVESEEAKRQRQEMLESLDQSVPLPDLEACITAFQTVLFHSMERLLELLHWKEDARKRKLAHKLLRTLWQDYLLAWQAGAEQYAALFPHVRFSLRDSFLCHPSHQAMIHKTLSYHALKKVRTEMKEQAAALKVEVPDETDFDNANDSNGRSRSNESLTKSASGKRARPDAAPSSQASLVDTSYAKDDASDDSDSDSAIGASSDESDNDDDDDDEEDADDPTDLPLKRRHRRPRPSENKVKHVVLVHTSRKLKTSTDIVLQPACKPSMTLAAGLLWLSVYRAGVTCSQVCHWIKSGSLPLLNAFGLLTEKQQHALKPMQYFFELSRPLSITKLEHVASLLAAVCQLKAEPDLMYRERKQHRLRMITAKSLAHVLAQMIADTGLSQAVLHRCLVLVGLMPLKQEDEEQNTEQPQKGRDKDTVSGPPLSPDQILRLEDAAALIAIACFLDPSWRKWTFSRPGRGLVTEDRVIPSNPEQLHWLGNGSRLDSYVEFMENMVLADEDTYSPALANLLLKDNSRAAKSADGEHSELSDSLGAAAIQPCRLVAGVPLNGCSTVHDIQPPVDPRKKLLIEFVAHSVGVSAVQVENSVYSFLLK